MNEDPIEIFQNLSSFIELEFEPVGKWFEQYNLIRHQGDAEAELDADSSSSEDEEEEDVPETKEYLQYLETLDPKNWKEQDHYVVLGIENLRWKATQHQIKKAHKNKVLKHHPDKQKQAGPVDPKERDFFACITKAFEQLSDPVKRMSFDSSDPTINDDVPAINEKNRNNFFKVFGPVFERNGRWSIKKRLPNLGDDKSTFEEVNDFYGFWYDFDSWREYSYLDEENKETATDRDERRWIDKENKAARAKRKKEEVKRIRQIVDNAYACDPRILKFKQDEKALKDAKKNQKKEAARQRQEEEDKIVEDARLAKLKVEEEEKLKADESKKIKEKEKKLIKKERKTLRTYLKDFNYFAKNENDKVKLVDEIETLVDTLSLTELQQINGAILASEKKEETAKTQIFNMLKSDKENKDEESLNTQMANVALAEASKAAQLAAEAECASSPWCDEEMKLLVKGVKLIPIGTLERWQVVANFIEEHSRGKFKRTGKEVLNKTKNLQKMDPKEKEEMNKKAYEKTLQSINPNGYSTDAPSQRTATPGEQLVNEQGSNPAPWSMDEQKVLEQALKTYPASLTDRWEQIAECLPTRSKKDCMVRYKELVEVIMAKKRAKKIAELA